MVAHNRKLADLVLDIGGNEYQIQCRSAEVVNNTDDAEFFPTFDSTNGGFIEAAEDAYALALEFYADWRAAGISAYLWEMDGQTVPFSLTHHPNIPAETVIFTGEVLIKAPNVGGEVRTTEVTSTTLTCNGKPEMTRP